MSNVHRLPLPVGIAALRVLDAARQPVAHRPDKDMLEAIAISLKMQEESLLLLDAAEQSGQPLYPHIVENLRYHAIKVQGLATNILNRALTDARNERSAGCPVPSPRPSLPGASDLVTYTDAPTLSDPCAGSAPNSTGTTAGASAQPRAIPARIRNAGAPDHSDEWPTCG